MRRRYSVDPCVLEGQDSGNIMPARTRHLPIEDANYGVHYWQTRSCKQMLIMESYIIPKQSRSNPCNVLVALICMKKLE
jgi:hypothetical protein